MSAQVGNLGAHDFAVEVLVAYNHPKISESGA
jgi:hypothetical protein